MPTTKSWLDVPYEEHSFGFGIAPEALNYAKGVGPIGSPDMIISYAKLMYGRPQTLEIKRRVAARVLASGGLAEFNADTAVHQWEHTPIYFDTVASIDENPEAISDNLPSKAKVAQDVYNIGANTSVGADDRLRAYRLYGELQGHITKGPQQVNINDNRSIILIPRRAVRGEQEDEAREGKVVEAQARLLKDASQG